MWQSKEILNVSNTGTLKEIFWKTKAFFIILGHRFLVESAKIEPASFPYGTAISEANFKTNRLVSTKCTKPITKNGVLPATTLFFWIFCFRLRIPYKELICYTNGPNIHTDTFRKCRSFTWGCFFPVSTLKILCLKFTYLDK